MKLYRIAIISLNSANRVYNGNAKFSVRWSCFGVRLDVFVIMCGELNSESCRSSLINEKNVALACGVLIKSLRCSANKQTSQNGD
jgi:hypothetical protein